ncbi:hypothetical protein [Pseudoxanthomonas sp. SE1]|uniref:hypothetical protein n=1 Tax=Pseudoxanthomonas sp. SE1 TaxID=1664560 RepID=UPI00240DF9F7|nr:hypothetical protein [Pseudoxanthomonas sp. SE1]WFC43164.1 hypothetical protein OY559_06555 [Pseudoxanthomonas sp. SE1]
MKFETLLGVLLANAPSTISKGVATAGVSAAAYTFSPWAWAAALAGAAMSFYFEPEKQPKEVRKVIYGILAMGFAAAVVAAVVPHIPLLQWTGNIELWARAAVLGLSIRFLWEQGKRIASGWKRTDGAR